MFIAHRVALVDRHHHCGCSQIGASEARVALVGHVQVDVRAASDRFGERQAGRHDERAIFAARLQVLQRKLLGHLRLVLAGPGHDEDGLGAMGTHGVTVLLRILEEQRRQPGAGA
jgi:hypothetical protein